MRRTSPVAVAFLHSHARERAHTHSFYSLTLSYTLQEKTEWLHEMEALKTEERRAQEELQRVCNERDDIKSQLDEIKAGGSLNGDALDHVIKGEHDHSRGPVFSTDKFDLKPIVGGQGGVEKSEGTISGKATRPSRASTLRTKDALGKRKPLSTIAPNRGMAQRVSKDKDEVASKTAASSKMLQLLQHGICGLYEQAHSLEDGQEVLVDIRRAADRRSGSESQDADAITPGDQIQRISQWLGAARNELTSKERVIKEQRMRIRTLEREWRYERPPLHNPRHSSLCRVLA